MSSSLHDDDIWSAKTRLVFLCAAVGVLSAMLIVVVLLSRCRSSLCYGNDCLAAMIDSLSAMIMIVLLILIWNTFRFPFADSMKIFKQS